MAPQSSVSPTRRAGLLRRHRAELAAILAPADWSDWPTIEQWAESARLVVREHYPARIADFDRATRQPLWETGELIADPEEAWAAVGGERERADAATIARLGAEAKASIHAFVDGLLGLDEERRDDEEEPMTERDRQQALRDLRKRLDAMAPPEDSSDWSSVTRWAESARPPVPVGYIDAFERAVAEPVWYFASRTMPGWRPGFAFGNVALDNARRQAESEEENRRIGAQAVAELRALLDELPQVADDPAAPFASRLTSPRIRLREALAEFFDDARKAKMFADDAGLNLSHIDFTGSADVVWHDVVAEAERQDRVAELLRVVRAKYPKFLHE